MSGTRQNIAVVSREYRASSDDCTRAIVLLLTKLVSKEGGPTTAPKDVERSSNASDVVPILHE